MKKIKYFFVIICLCQGLHSRAQQPFTAGNIVVYRVGDGSAVLDLTAAKVYLDEYTPDGVLIQSILMPTTASGANKVLTAHGAASGEGFLNLSTNGKYLVVPGINTPLGGSASTATVLGVIDYNGLVNTSTAVTDFAGNNFPCSAISDDGNRLWFSGPFAVRYTTLGSNSSMLVSAPSASVNTLNITNGQLYTGVATGQKLFSVGSGLPTTSGQTLSGLSGLPTNIQGPGQFAFADLEPSIPGPDVIYVASTHTLLNPAVGIRKFSLVGGMWIDNGSVGGNVSNSFYKGLTIKVSGSTVAIFTTKQGNNNNSITGGDLVKIIDNSGYNATMTGTPNVIASVTTPNTMSFRGVARVPLECPSVGGLQVTDITATQATISWNAVAGGPNYEYIISTSPNAIGAGTVTSRIIDTVTGLSNGITYYAHVRTICGPGKTSEWITVMFITSCKPPATPLLNVSVSSSGFVTAKWNKVYGAQTYEYFISTNPNPPTNGIPVNDTTVSTSGFSSITQYYLHVRSNCGGTAFSTWVTKAFTTSCFMPAINVSVLHNDAVATWNKIGNAIKYEYAMTNTEAKPLSGTYTADTFYLMNNRRDGSANYFHVRSICSNGTVSEWSTGGFHIQGIQVYPNPAKEILNININGLGNTTGHIYIMDAIGRIVKQIKAPGNSITVDTRAWAAGMYLIRYDDGQNKYTVRIMRQ